MEVTMAQSMNQSAVMDMIMKEQKNEITAHHIYKRLSEVTKDSHNADVLRQISEDELKHYHQLKELSGKEISPNRMKIRWFVFLSRVLGLTFGVKLLEEAEDEAQDIYGEHSKEVKAFNAILEDEEHHEQMLIDMLDEERLNYMGSVVLGLNDALVELTGALAGYTFAFQDTKLIALTGLITGISASFSMAASEYLSAKQEEESGIAKKSAIYTGIAYIFTVIFLILPFLLIGNPFVSLGVTLMVAVLIIFVFNFYVAVAKSLNFVKRFAEMATISLGVAGISFLIGVLVKTVIGIDI